VIDFHCPTCAQKYSVNDEFAGKKATCRKCQAKIVVPVADTRPFPPEPSQPREMKPTERVFFDSLDVKITSARAILGEQIFALANVSSVHMEEIIIPLNPVPFFVGLLAGIFFISVGVGIPLVGVSQAVGGVGVVPLCILAGCILAGFAFIAATLYALNQHKPESVYTVTLAAAGGERKLLETRDKSLVVDIVAAINEAIIYRG
jgi:hypothetical protein